MNFGLATDILVPADFDGDGKTDFGVFRANEDSSQPDFYYMRSSDSTLQGVIWGTINDIPFINDFDGDGKADVAVYRPSTGIWYQLRSAGGFAAYKWGISSDIPSESAYLP